MASTRRRPAPASPAPRHPRAHAPACPARRQPAPGPPRRRPAEPGSGASPKLRQGPPRASSVPQTRPSRSSSHGRRLLPGAVQAAHQGEGFLVQHAAGRAKEGAGHGGVGRIAGLGHGRDGPGERRGRGATFGRIIPIDPRRRSPRPRAASRRPPCGARPAPGGESASAAQRPPPINLGDGGAAAEPGLGAASVPRALLFPHDIACHDAGRARLPTICAGGSRPGTTA